MRNLRGPLGHALHSKYRMLNILGIACIVFVVLQQTLQHIQRPRIIRHDTIPHKIWQSWKVDALHFEDRDLDRARTWARKNPSHRYELLTDSNAVPYVEQAFGCGPGGLCRPDIVSTYVALSDNLKIIQADLLRYIIMYVDGGLWADIDVEDIQPIRTFIPRAYDQRDIDMVIGVETDEPGLANHPTLGSKAQSFCQWTFMCKPGLPVMMRLIENILVWLHRLAQEQDKAVSELHLDFDEVLSGTGPSAFTKAILAEMSVSTGESITWDDFHGLVDSQVVGGVLVLPSEAFAAGTGHSGSGNHRGSRALVKHHFHASSWTSKHQRFKHPVYDEVERCNWDVDCVNLWDSNVAFYDSLPETEQLKMIELKRLDEAKAKKLEESMKAPPAPPPGAVEQVPMGGEEQEKPDGKDQDMTDPGEMNEADALEDGKPDHDEEEEADDEEKRKTDKSLPPPSVQQPAPENEKGKEDPFAIVDGKIIPAKAGGQMLQVKHPAPVPAPDEQKTDVELIEDDQPSLDASKVGGEVVLNPTRPTEEEQAPAEPLVAPQQQEQDKGQDSSPDLPVDDKDKEESEREKPELEEPKVEDVREGSKEEAKTEPHNEPQEEM